MKRTLRPILTSNMMVWCHECTVDDESWLVAQVRPNIGPESDSHVKDLDG